MVYNRAPKGSLAVRESRGTHGNPAGTGGSGIKNFKCGTRRDCRKENAFPQNCRNSRTIKILSHLIQIVKQTFLSKLKHLSKTQIILSKSLSIFLL